MQIGAKRAETCMQRVHIPTELPFLHTAIGGWEERKKRFVYLASLFSLLACLSGCVCVCVSCQVDFHMESPQIPREGGRGKKGFFKNSFRHSRTLFFFSLSLSPLLPLLLHGRLTSRHCFPFGGKGGRKKGREEGRSGEC